MGSAMSQPGSVRCNAWFPPLETFFTAPSRGINRFFGMLNSVGYLMVTVSDMKRSVRFYRDTIGLPLRYETSDWTEFETGRTTLALHGGGRPREQSTAQGRPENYAGTCTIGFNVENLEETFKSLKSKGANFVMVPTLREGEGIKLAVCVDPDGLMISFAQSVPRDKELIASAPQAG